MTILTGQVQIPKRNHKLSLWEPLVETILMESDLRVSLTACTAANQVSTVEQTLEQESSDDKKPSQATNKLKEKNKSNACERLLGVNHLCLPLLHYLHYSSCSDQVLKNKHLKGRGRYSSL